MKIKKKHFKKRKENEIASIPFLCAHRKDSMFIEPSEE